MKRFLLFFLPILSVLTSAAQDRTDSMHVAHYDIYLNITDFANHKVLGHTDLSVVSKVPELRYVDLDLQQLAVDSVCVDDFPTTDFSANGNVVRVNLQSPVSQFDTVRLRVYYQGVPARDSYFGGFYFKGQYAYNLGVAFRDLPHNFGRAWYPCLDFFTDKSTYDFHIETELGKTAICGGELVDSVLLDSTVVWNWHLSQPVPTYLTSVAVGEYVHYRDTVQGVERILPIDIYTYPSDYDDIPGTFSHLKDVLHIFEREFGPYPWNRIGYVGVNFNGGAMEHVANIAYPNFAINGNATYESLYIHEFSHMWFGDLVTCNRAEEMWINEGFARYNEALADEALYPTSDPLTDGYRVNIRNLHRGVLRDAHIDDGGYWALDSMPQQVTYGTTTYDKGGLVVHALRKYMGDSIFFETVRDYLSAFAYQNVSTEQLFDFFEQRSGVPLHDFYLSQVHQPGFLHFSVDSIRPAEEAGHYRFFVRQRLSHALFLGNSNKIDITFFSSDRQQFTIEDFEFSGEFAQGEVDLPFEPLFAVVDLDEKLADAVVDYNFLVTSTGLNNATATNARLRVDAFTDTTFFRVEDNYVAPDGLKVENENVTEMSNAHYWRMSFAPEGTIEGNLRFAFSATDPGKPDYDLLHGHTPEDVVLLYRRDAADDWQIIPSSLSGSITVGAISTTLVRSGEYALAIGNRAATVEESVSNTPVLYPNPSSNSLTISNLSLFSNSSNLELRMVDASGRMVKNRNLRGDASEISLNVENLKSGVYFLQIFDENRLVWSGKFIKK